MKKIILLAAVLLGTIAQAQNIAYTTDGGEIIENNDVFTFSSNEEPESKMLIHLKNNGEETFRFKIRVDEVVGNPDTGMSMGVQFCFSGTCYFSVVPGNLYPNAPVTLEPGENNDPTDHFLNENPGVDGNPVTYKFTVVEVNENGQIVQDNLLTFTYKYDADASIDDFTALKNMGLTLGSTVVKSQLDVTANTVATLQLFDGNGKKVKEAAISEGSQSIDVSALSSGMYFANFKTQDNKVSGIIIVKN
jgi:hypothetical protein